ncbi:unnamed protein product [Cuscuta europaea]|uniref:GRF-type domain-containing protein n=1 Tax=Cuscuta europaea TaxID=41803 RepID=A0A9P0ZYA0_CUSEU|nr:unnamed protein product [Cuscuta europaea]
MTKSLMKSVSGSSSWTCNSSRVEIGRTCHHKIEAKLRTVKSGPNLGRRFHGCSLWPNSDCGFFQWCNDNDIQDNVHKMKNKDLLIDQLLAENRALEEKVQKLKKKKKELAAMITGSSLVACKSCRGETFAIMVVVASLIVFGIVSFLK